MNGEHLFSFLMFVLGLCVGALLVIPMGNYKEKIKAEGAVAVYEGRAACEQALGQWVCSIPKD